jgi:hypothetical protein
MSVKFVASATSKRDTDETCRGGVARLPCPPILLFRRLVVEEALSILGLEALSRYLDGGEWPSNPTALARLSRLAHTRLLLPQVDRCGPRYAMTAGRHAMAPWTKVAIDERVSEQELLGLAGRAQSKKIRQ